jgi:hypothetical protein
MANVDAATDVSSLSAMPVTTQMPSPLLKFIPSATETLLPPPFAAVDAAGIIRVLNGTSVPQVGAVALSYSFKYAGADPRPASCTPMTIPDRGFRFVELSELAAIKWNGVAALCACAGGAKQSATARAAGANIDLLGDGAILFF